MRHSEKVREFIVENFLYGDGEKLKEGTSFLAGGIIDSTGILELVSFLEETFGITVLDEEMVPDNLDSLRSIEVYLERKIGK